jgi:hypothetical protein
MFVCMCACMYIYTHLYVCLYVRLYPQMALKSHSPTYYVGNFFAVDSQYSNKTTKQWHLLVHYAIRMLELVLD